MHIFITGGSGWVGSGVVKQLLARGDRVTSLARSDQSAARLEAAGAQVLRGELADLDALTAGARSADAVIHCGFVHDFSNYMASVETDKRAIETIGTALAGSHKPFLVTTGLGVVPKGPLRTEDDEADASRVPRLSEQTGLAQLGKGVRVGIVRLPPTVHGSGDHGFVAALVDIARQKGRSAYVGSGENVWPAVHRDDAARVFVLALDKGRAGERYHAVQDEGVPFRRIAEVIGNRLGLPVASVPTPEAAAQFGWMANFAQFDVASSSALTRSRLGWSPTGPALIEDLEQGSYFAR